jgi:exonuclease SbcD
MSTYRFVHAADLHLDSPFKGMLAVAPAIAAQLQSATFDAFQAIVDLCISEQVDALLVAGDVFDSVDHSLPAQLAFGRGLRQLDEAGISSFVCHGNHDPSKAWDARIVWPPSAYRFPTHVEAVPLVAEDDSSPMVYGFSYAQAAMQENVIPKFKKAYKPGRVGIGLLHANVGGQEGHENYAPCTLTDLGDVGIGYWALGHVHTRREDKAGNTIAAYPGNPQGRHPTETGARGVYLVNVADGHFSTEFRATDVVRWGRIQVDISALSDQVGLESAIFDSLEQLRVEAEERHLVYRLSISGRGELHSLVADAAFASALQEQLNDRYENETPFAFCERVAVDTRPPINRDDRLAGGGFVGDLLQMVDEIPKDETLRAQLVGALDPMFTAPRLRELLQELAPTADSLQDLVSRAEDLFLDVLGEDA